MPGVLQVAMEGVVVSASERNVVSECVFIFGLPTTRALLLHLF